MWSGGSRVAGSARPRIHLDKYLSRPCMQDTAGSCEKLSGEH